MPRQFALRLLAGWAACLPALLAAEKAAVTERVAVTEPPYEIILRGRIGHVTPERSQDAQTSGGYIEVLQTAPDSVLVQMRGAVAAAAEQYKGGSASMEFELNQDFEIVATRTGLRPPRLILVGQVVGNLAAAHKGGGTAEQAPACAAVNSGGQPVLKFCVEPHAVAGGQKLFVNDQQGPFELTVVPGPFCLHQTFAISAAVPTTWCHHLGAGAAAVYDPDPRFDGRYNTALKSTRGVPHQNYGFGVLLQVVEEPPPGIERLPPPPTQVPGPGPGPERLPPPHRLGMTELPADPGTPRP